MDMKSWMRNLSKSRKPIPILSFPSVQLTGVSVYELTHSAELQTQGMIKIAECTDAAASVSMMDLSVEAEAFGCEIKALENEVPTVVGALIADEEQAKGMSVPSVGDGRTGMYVKAASDAKKAIKDRPVFAGIIGPFSLAGRLMDVSEAMVYCIADPDFVHITMKKTTEFLKAYVRAYKDAGLDGIVMAEPLSGLLSPDLEEECVAPYVKELIGSVQDDNFAVIYHNCGPNVPIMAKSIANNGAAAYHFGDAVSLKAMLDVMPSDRPVMGNISPVSQFKNGTPESMQKAVWQLLDECSAYPNFVLSSGCDIPPATPMENVDAFFSAAQNYYDK